jgi:PAS domain S-box-containing protein
MTPDTPTPLPDLGALSPLAQEVAETMARVASDIALVIDGQGVIRNVAEGRSALQAGCTDWIGRRWVDTVTADTRPKIELLLNELQLSGVTQRREVNHPALDGDAVPVAWTAIRLGEGGPVVAVGRDLRAVAAIQRRFLDAQHEIELDYWQRRHADSRYQLLFQVASDAVLTLDADTLEVIEANDAANAVLGSAGSPGGHRLADLLPVAARAAVIELLVTARTSGRPCEIRLLRSLVESTPDALVITDAAGLVVLANPAFVSLVQGGSESRIKGRSLTDVVDDRDGRWRDLVTRTRLHGLCPRSPLIVTPGGLSLSVEVSSTLLAEGDQERLGFTLRTAEPAAAPVDSGALDVWPGLWALRAQVGLVPLATLVREAADAAERQFIHTALRLAGGQLVAAARMLQMEPQALSARMLGLQLESQGIDDDVGTPPRSSFN